MTSLLGVRSDICKRKGSDKQHKRKTRNTLKIIYYSIYLLMTSCEDVFHALFSIYQRGEIFFFWKIKFRGLLYISK